MEEDVWGIEVSIFIALLDRRRMFAVCSIISPRRKMGVCISEVSREVLFIALLIEAGVSSPGRVHDGLDAPGRDRAETRDAFRGGLSSDLCCLEKTLRRASCRRNGVVADMRVLSPFRASGWVFSL